MRIATRVAVKPIDRHQTGVALITVLLIVFLATVAATSLASLEQYAIRRSTLLQHQQQARLYALAAEQWAALILKRDLLLDLEDNRRVDSLDEEWAALSPTLPVEGGFIKGRIKDLQGCFNLNNLLKTGKRSEEGVDPAQQQRNLRKVGRATDKTGEDEDAGQETPSEESSADADESAEEDEDAAAEDSGDKDAKDQKDQKEDKDSVTTEGKAANKQQLEMFQRLLEILELDPNLADAILDWTDIDQDQRPNGAEDGEYAGHDPTYATADRPLISVSELRLVKGIDRTVYNKLFPYVCALPPGTSVNVNTAPPVVLAALDESRDLDRFTQDKDGEKAVYEKVSDFLKEKSLGGQALPARIDLSVNSRYFSIEIEAQVGEGRARLHSILERSENGETQALYRSFGNEF